MREENARETSVLVTDTRGFTLVLVLLVRLAGPRLPLARGGLLAHLARPAQHDGGGGLGLLGLDLLALGLG